MSDSTNLFVAMNYGPANPLSDRMIELNVDGEIVTVEVDRVINAGYSGRDEEAVQAHIDELLTDGIDAPETVPTTYEVAPYTLLSDPDSVRVVGENTSGEAEYALIVTSEETYVVAASDQTDRTLERESIQKAKQIAPNVISRDAWRLSDVRDHWDDIEIRAWNTVDGERYPYQDTTLASILEPAHLVETISKRYGKPLHGTVILSGTVATVTGELAPGTPFEVELTDPIRDRSLSLGYTIDSA